MQQNRLTHWFDLSQVYGNSDSDVKEVKTGGLHQNNPGKGQIEAKNAQRKTHLVKICSEEGCFLTRKSNY